MAGSHMDEAVCTCYRQSATLREVRSHMEDQCPSPPLLGVHSRLLMRDHSR